MIKKNFNIAESHLSLFSDVKFQNINNINYFSLDKSQSRNDASIEFRRFSQDQFVGKELNKIEKSNLVKCIDFQPRWLTNQVFRFSPFRGNVIKSLINPEMTQIVLNWNRAIIRDYNNNNFSYFFPEEKEHEFMGPLFIARLRNLISNTFPLKNKVMIHGASIIINGRAILFLAPDEGGKSTLIKMAAGKRVLSDDQIVLESKGEETIVHSTPFGELSDGPFHAKLGGIFILKKSDQFCLEPVSADIILKFIWNDQYIKWYQYPNNLKIRIFDILNSTSRCSPAFRLNFTKERVDWQSIAEVMLN